jgi:hypothetical protein
MEKADQYAFFSPNYFAAKKTQIKLEKLLNTDIKEYDHNIFTPNKKKEWRVQYNATKKFFPKDSQYNLKQIVKNFKLNREQFLHGYSNKYINLCTDLLYENSKNKYAKKRLFLLEYRQNVLKNHLTTSFDDYVQKEPLSEKYNFSKQNLNNIYLTQVISKFNETLLKCKNKNKSYSKTSRRNDARKNLSLNKKILVKELSNDIITNNNKFKLSGLNTKRKIKDKFYSYQNSRKKLQNDKRNNYNKIYGTEANIYETSSDSNEEEVTNNKESGINNYTEKINDESKYFEEANPREEYFKGRNKAKYIDHLKNKYNFFTSRKSKDYKNYSEVKNRQLLFYTGKDKLEIPNKNPFQKEFFKKINMFNYNQKKRTKNGFKRNEEKISENKKSEFFDINLLIKKNKK